MSGSANRPSHAKVAPEVTSLLVSPFILRFLNRPNFDGLFSDALDIHERGPQSY